MILTPSFAAINYTVNAGSFYYFALKPNSNAYSQGIFIRFTYQTDLYQCPYLTGAIDYNLNFQGCSVNAPTQYPICILNDVFTGYCKSCASPYKLNSFGVCYIDLGCPDNQYYHYGKCYNVIDNCAVF